MTASKRVAFVTGASRGLGRVIAQVLAEQGHDLVIAARDKAALDDVRNQLLTRGGKVVAIAGDVTDASLQHRWIDTARALGGLDVLVNNASELGGIGPLQMFDIQRF